MSHQEPISKTFTLQERIAQWREQEALANADESTHSGMYSSGRAFAFGRCADEAELIVKEALTAAALPGRAQASPERDPLTLNDVLGWIDQRLAEYLIDPADDGYRRGIRAARAQIQAVRDDKVCPCCGYPEHRANKPGISLAKLLRRDLASADAAVQEPNPLLKFACHFEKCAANPDAYPYHWRESDRAMCDCGLAPLMPLGED